MHYKYGAAKNGDVDIAREKELIERVQKYDDKLAMKQLMASYNGMLRSTITMSGIIPSMDMNTALSYGETHLKEAIRRYDPLTGNQPNTYLVRYVKNKMMNLKAEALEEVSHMADDGTRYNNYRMGANGWLAAEGIEPTPEITYDFIQNEFKKGGTKMTVEKIKRAEALSRKELSGDKVLGGSDSLAEAVTQAEMFNKDDSPSGNELFYENQKKEEIKALLNGSEFSRPERLFIRKWAGLDDLGLNKTLNIRQAAINAGISEPQAKEAIRKLKEKGKLKGVL